MTTEKITITMTDRAPITITKADWPAVADAKWHSGEHECQANEVARMRVREHADGRRIVYGYRERGNGGMPAGYRGQAAGFLVAPGPRNAFGSPVRMTSDGVEHPDPSAETIRAIRRVAGLLDMGELGNDLIADLPAEELV